MLNSYYLVWRPTIISFFVNYKISINRCIYGDPKFVVRLTTHTNLNIFFCVQVIVESYYSIATGVCIKKFVLNFNLPVCCMLMLKVNNTCVITNYIEGIKCNFDIIWLL